MCAECQSLTSLLESRSLALFVAKETKRHYFLIIHHAINNRHEHYVGWGGGGSSHIFYNLIKQVTLAFHYHIILWRFSLPDTIHPCHKMLYTLSFLLRNPLAIQTERRLDKDIFNPILPDTVHPCHKIWYTLSFLLRNPLVIQTEWRLDKDFLNPIPPFLSLA